MRILIIEDEKKVANFIKKGLEEEHYAVDNAYDGEAGLYMTEANEYDLIVLDLMIPKIDGLEVLKRIRGNKKQCPHTGFDRQEYCGRYCKGAGCRL